MRELIDVMHELTRTILNPYDVAELLHRLTGHVLVVLDAQGAGIMLEDADGSLGFAAATDGRTAELEKTQDQLHEGACEAAFRQHETVAVADLSDDPRWPTYRKRALDLGFRSVLGIPLEAHGETIGVLNVYREQPGSWSPDDVRAAEILAATGAAYVLHANQLKASQELSEQLQAALRSRAVIERAKGLLMATAGVDEHEAFDLLRETSMRQNRRLRVVAEETVARLGPRHESLPDQGDCGSFDGYVSDRGDRRS